MNSYLVHMYLQNSGWEIPDDNRAFWLHLFASYALKVSSLHYTGYIVYCYSCKLWEVLKYWSIEQSILFPVASCKNCFNKVKCVISTYYCAFHISLSYNFWSLLFRAKTCICVIDFYELRDKYTVGSEKMQFFQLTPISVESVQFRQRHV